MHYRAAGKNTNHKCYQKTEFDLRNIFRIIILTLESWCVSFLVFSCLPVRSSVMVLLRMHSVVVTALLFVDCSEASDRPA